LHFHHLNDAALLNLRLITIMVFFLALAYGAKKRLINARELIWVGAVLVIAAAMMTYPLCVKTMIETIGYSRKAFLWAAAPVLTLVVALVFALRVMVQRMEDSPEQPPKKHLMKAARVKTNAKPSSPTLPQPKPQRARGGKRRF
jgi:hypothetical protein